MAIWKKAVSIDGLAKRSENTMVTHCGITFTEIGDNYLIATMPVDEKTKQPIGIMHGGASCVLAESIGSVAANMAVDDHHYCVGLSINTSHIRSAREGHVTAKTFARHLGRSTHVWQIDITDGDDQLISATTLTMMVLPKKT